MLVFNLIIGVTIVTINPTKTTIVVTTCHSIKQVLPSQRRLLKAVAKALKCEALTVAPALIVLTLPL